MNTTMNYEFHNVEGLTELGKAKKSIQRCVLCSAQPLPPGMAGDARGCWIQYAAEEGV